MRGNTFSAVIVGLLCWRCIGQENHGKEVPQSETGKVTAHSGGLHGYIGFSASPPPLEYGAGMGFYSAVWPLIDRPLAGFQIGLAQGVRGERMGIGVVRQAEQGFVPAVF